MHVFIIIRRVIQKYHVHIYLYKTTPTTKSLGGRMDRYIPRDALKFIKVHEWTGASNECLKIY